MLKQFFFCCAEYSIDTWGCYAKQCRNLGAFKWLSLPFIQEKGIYYEVLD